MTSRQDMKADARESAKTAPPADPETAKAALEDAKGKSGAGSHVQPVYKTQDDVAGENVHRDKDEVISEFDTVAENTVRK